MILAICAAGAFLWVRSSLRANHKAWTQYEGLRERTERAHDARGSDYEDVLRSCIDAGGIDPERGAEMLFREISSQGNPRIARLLLDAGADPNFQDGIALPVAVKNEFYFLALRLIEKGVNVNANKGDMTALHWCCLQLLSMDQLDLPHALLAKGADPNARNKEGCTPLHLLGFGHRDDDDVGIALARLLIARGADINARNNEGFTPLQTAKRHRMTYLAEFLASKGGE